MRLRNSKKGVTLVELIAVCAISVAVIAAACTLLYMGSKSAARGAAQAASHGDAHLLETYLQSELPTAVSVGADKPGDSAGAITAFRFDPDGTLAVETNGAPQYIDGIESVALSLSQAGGNRKLSYTIRAGGDNGSYTLSGGVVLNNVTGTPDAGPWELRPGSDTEFYLVKAKN